MIYDRYYYSTLSDADKHGYKRMYDGITAFEPHIALPNTATPPEMILRYIGLDNPHIFYADFNHCVIGSSSFGKSIEITYWYTKAEAEQINAKVGSVLSKMLSRVSGSTEYEKELSVHDLLIENIKYDHSALENVHKHSPRSNSILGVLFYKTAVCDGVAKVFKMLLNMLDIKCIVAVGAESRHGVPHAWNIVKIGGKAYHVDATWDLYENGNAVLHDYFNLNDADILADHSPERKYPVCDCSKNNYFERNDLVANSLSAAEKCLRAAVLFGEKSVSVKLKCPADEFERNAGKIIDFALQSHLVRGNSCKYSYNEAQKIVTIEL